MTLTELTLFSLFVAIVYSVDTTQDRRRAFVRAILLTSLFYAIHQILLSSEGFLFEVTDWKKTCGQKRGMKCSQCCAPGFNGQNVCFDYTGDHERMNMQQNGCACAKQSTIKQNPRNYRLLEQTCPKEEYSYDQLSNTSPCNAQRIQNVMEPFSYDHALLGQTSPCAFKNSVACTMEEEPVAEEYCGSCSM